MSFRIYKKIHFLIISLAFMMMPGYAQTTCSKANETTLCSGEEISAFATTTVSESDPEAITLNSTSKSTLTKVGDTVLEINSAATQSAIATTIGSTTIINRSDGSTATSHRVDNTTFLNESSGQVVVCQQFGSVTLCN